MNKLQKARELKKRFAEMEALYERAAVTRKQLARATLMKIIWPEAFADGKKAGIDTGDLYVGRGTVSSGVVPVRAHIRRTDGESYQLTLGEYLLIDGDKYNERELIVINKKWDGPREEVTC